MSGLPSDFPRFVMRASSFGAATFVGLRTLEAVRIPGEGRLRLEDVASGYWTLLAK